MNGFITVATPVTTMVARDRPTPGIDHLTVVPRNFEPEGTDDAESESDAASTA